MIATVLASSMNESVSCPSLLNITNHQTSAGLPPCGLFCPLVADSTPNVTFLLSRAHHVTSIKVISISGQLDPWSVAIHYRISATDWQQPQQNETTFKVLQLSLGK